MEKIEIRDINYNNETNTIEIDVVLKHNICSSVTFEFIINKQNKD